VPDRSCAGPAGAKPPAQLHGKGKCVAPGIGDRPVAARSACPFSPNEQPQDSQRSPRLACKAAPTRRPLRGEQMSRGPRGAGLCQPAVSPESSVDRHRPGVHPFRFRRLGGCRDAVYDIRATGSEALARRTHGREQRGDGCLRNSPPAPLPHEYKRSMPSRIFGGPCGHRWPRSARGRRSRTRPLPTRPCRGSSTISPEPVVDRPRRVPPTDAVSSEQDCCV
jgi:hypothetical protein